MPAYNFNRYPRGLLSLIDSKQQGKSPQLIDDSIQGGLDFLQFWMSSILEHRTGVTANLTATGFFPVLAGALTVPQDEIWILNNLVVSHGGLDLAAGTTYELVPAAVQIGLHLLSLGNAAGKTYTTGDRIWTAMETPPMFLLPGTELGVFVQQATLGTAIAMTLYAQLAPLKI